MDKVKVFISLIEKVANCNTKKKIGYVPKSTLNPIWTEFAEELVKIGMFENNSGYWINSKFLERFTERKTKAK